MHSCGPGLPHRSETLASRHLVTEFKKKVASDDLSGLKNQNYAVKLGEVLGRFNGLISHVFLTDYHYWFKSFYSNIKVTILVEFLNISQKCPPPSA